MRLTLNDLVSSTATSAAYYSCWGFDFTSNRNNSFRLNYCKYGRTYLNAQNTFNVLIKALRPGHINQLDSTVVSGRDQSVYVAWPYNSILYIILVSLPTVWLGSAPLATEQLSRVG